MRKACVPQKNPIQKAGNKRAQRQQESIYGDRLNGVLQSSMPARGVVVERKERKKPPPKKPVRQIELGKLR